MPKALLLKTSVSCKCSKINKHNEIKLSLNSEFDCCESFAKLFYGWLLLFFSNSSNCVVALILLLLCPHGLS